MTVPVGMQTAAVQLQSNELSLNCALRLLFDTCILRCVHLSSVKLKIKEHQCFTLKKQIQIRHQIASIVFKWTFNVTCFVRFWVQTLLSFVNIQLVVKIMISESLPEICHHSNLLIGLGFNEGFWHTQSCLSYSHVVYCCSRLLLFC